MKKPNVRVREIIERRKRFPLSANARQKALCSRTEYSDVELMGWSPNIKARRAAANKTQEKFEQRIRKVIRQCCADHPGISTEPEVLGGIPHLEGTRLSVGQIVGRVRALGSVKAVADYYSPDITEKQVKEAMSYVQDFIERACDPYQTDD